MNRTHRSDIADGLSADRRRLSRRRFLRASGGLALAGTTVALSGGCERGTAGSRRAQPARIPRIGYLGAAFSPPTLAFRQALRDLGWVEDESIVIEFGSGQDTKPEIPVNDLLTSGVDLLVAAGDQYVQAAQAVTTTTPIVMVDSSDPVGLGFVASLGRPGGNITGLSGFVPQLNGKRLELLMEAMPSLRRVAVLWNPEALTAEANFRATQAAADALGVEVQSWDFTDGVDLIRRHWYAFDTQPERRVEALVVLRDAVAEFNIWRISEHARGRSLPSMYPFRHGLDITPYNQVDRSGAFWGSGLMCYTANVDDLSRRAAGYVDKILRGATPAELPVEQPSSFDFVLNLATAQRIGFTFPPSILAQATEVIR